LKPGTTPNPRRPTHPRTPRPRHGERVVGV
jgi:hypothetical protein